MDEPNKIYFTVDSFLLKELGERLVGRPHIALGELVKNSYDADATHVVISLEGSRIEVADNGNGMSFQAFRDFWMRVGTPHKQAERWSRRLGRPLTGSKGIGRLAVQFLAEKIELRTVAFEAVHGGRTATEIDAFVDWEKAVEAGELTSAEAIYSETPAKERFPEGKRHGTKIILSRLHQEWGVEEIAALAREIWSLQPPFRASPGSETREAFSISLMSSEEEKVREFEEKIRGYVTLWYARLSGRLVEVEGDAGRGLVRLSIEFQDGYKLSADYYVDECFVTEVEFEVRVYSLSGRQKLGLKVQEVRDYLNKFGGVHMYDSGFHMPYYGVDTDWLNIEKDHSHRLSRSKLLPEELQISGGLNNLPTNTRLLGVVHVNTSYEREQARAQGRDRPGEYLEIQVTRDRLADNKAYRSLKRIVRYGLDLYAMEETKRKIAEAERKRPTQAPVEAVEHIDEVLEGYASLIPPKALSSIRASVEQALEAERNQTEFRTHQLALLAPLATAGMCSLAYEHEFAKQMAELESIARQVEAVAKANPMLAERLMSVSSRMRAWVERTRGVRKMFSHLLEEEDREVRERLRARPVIERCEDQVRVFLRGSSIDLEDIDPSLRLPKGSFAEWSAIFQNIFVNAMNAMVDTVDKLIKVEATSKGDTRTISVNDTGVGVDLETSEELFRPFVRDLRISPERRALGLGGSGIGLTIVRMLAENMGCRVGFVSPRRGFSTTIEISWREGR